jgi:acetyl-CoA carboxylase alpha subunit
MESGSGAAVAHVVGDVVLRLTCAVFIIVPPDTCRMEVAEHLREE